MNEVVSERSPLWLNEMAESINSQFGEDGIIEAILGQLPTHDDWCVEFGAWDGKHLSNTYNLIATRGFSAVLIDGDPERIGALRANFAKNPHVHPLLALVGWEGDNTLDGLLATTPIPRDFDLLSIDIDGNDWHVWKAVRSYRPKVVVVEFNCSIANTIEFVQAPEPRTKQGSSLLAFVNLAKSMGYDLVATTTSNAFFVDHAYFDSMDVSDTRIEVLHADQSWVTHIFFGYDGSAHITGRQVVPWHGVKITDRQLQVVPRPLRKFPPDFGKARRAVLLAFRIWARIMRGKAEYGPTER